MPSEKIVMIDDEHDLVSLVGARLSRHGYRVTTFTDAAEAIRCVRETLPDLVITDVQMPELNGFEVCDLIRQHPKTKHIPIIILTGVEKAKEQALSVERPGVRYVSKAYGNEHLLEAIKGALDVSCIE